MAVGCNGGGGIGRGSGEAWSFWSVELLVVAGGAAMASLIRLYAQSASQCREPYASLSVTHNLSRSLARSPTCARFLFRARTRAHALVLAHVLSVWEVIALARAQHNTWCDVAGQDSSPTMNSQRHLLCLPSHPYQPHTDRRCALAFPTYASSPTTADSCAPIVCAPSAPQQRDVKRE